jgi:hypothetical protein
VLVTVGQAEWRRQVFWAGGPGSGVGTMSPGFGHTFLCAGDCQSLRALSSQKRDDLSLPVPPL